MQMESKNSRMTMILGLIFNVKIQLHRVTAEVPEYSVKKNTNAFAGKNQSTAESLSEVYLIFGRRPAAGRQAAVG